MPGVITVVRVSRVLLRLGAAAARLVVLGACHSKFNLNDTMMVLKANVDLIRAQ